MSTPIDLYFWTTPNGWKASIALEEMGLDYTTHYVDINAGDQFKPDFLAIAPNNRIPAIVDPDGPGGAPISVFESGAILQYLGRKTGKLYPAGERARTAVDEWLMWQMGGLGPMAGQAHHFLRYAPEFDPPQDIPYAKERYHTECRRLYGVLDRRLADRDFVAGDYSIADIAIWCWADRHERHDVDFAEFPNVDEWCQRIAARPAVQRGRTLGKDHVHETVRTRAAQNILFTRKV